MQKYARDAQDVLRGEEQFYRAWGVAIDGSLTDDEAFTAALPSCWAQAQTIQRRRQHDKALRELTRPQSGP